MLDAILDWALVFLPTVLSVVGVLVSIKAPHSKHHRTWRISLVIVGLFVSGVTLWQQARARSSHAAEVTSLNTKIADLSSTIRGLGGTLKTIETNTGQPPKVEVHVPPSKSPVVVVTPQSKPQRMLGIEQREKLVSILKGATPISITVLHAQGDLVSILKGATPQSKPQVMLGIEQREKLVSILKGATPISITVLQCPTCVVAYFVE